MIAWSWSVERCANTNKRNQNLSIIHHFSLLNVKRHLIVGAHCARRRIIAVEEVINSTFQSLFVSKIGNTLYCFSTWGINDKLSSASNYYYSEQNAANTIKDCRLRHLHILTFISVESFFIQIKLTPEVAQSSQHNNTTINLNHIAGSNVNFGSGNAESMYIIQMKILRLVIIKFVDFGAREKELIIFAFFAVIHAPATGETTAASSARSRHRLGQGCVFSFAIR